MALTHDTFMITPGLNTAFLPPAPSCEIVPAPSDDPDRTEILGQLVALHYTAFVAVWGPPPPKVTVQAVNINTAENVTLPTYQATLGDFPDHSAVDWLHAFEAGLDRWAEAEMANPLTLIPSIGDPETLELHIAEYEHVLVGACRRLKHLRRLDALRHLSVLLEGKLPPRYDPDHPDFAKR